MPLGIHTHLHSIHFPIAPLFFHSRSPLEPIFLSFFLHSLSSSSSRICSDCYSWVLSVEIEAFERLPYQFIVAMQKGLLAAASRTSLFSHFGGRFGDSSLKLQSNYYARGFAVAWKGHMVTRAGQQIEQVAGQDPKVEMDSEDEDEIASASHPQTRKAYRDDMEESYGIGYATRASDMGYGERYGETVKAILNKKHDKMEMQQGASAERDQNADAFVDTEYDTTQGEPVAEKEVGRHSHSSSAFEAERTE